MSPARAAGVRSARAHLLAGNADFRRYWLSQTASALGASVAGIAIPLLLLHVTGSIVLAGAVATVRLVAMNAARLPLGVMADRWPRRRVLLVCDGIRALLWTGVLTSLLVGGFVSVLMTVAVIEGVVGALANPSGAAAVRRLVPTAQLVNAVSVSEARSHAVSLAGPAAGGALFAVASWGPVAVNLACYAISWWWVSRIRTDLGGGTTATGPAPAAGRSLRADLLVGLRYVWTNRFLRALMLWSAVLNFATAGAFFGLVPVLEAAGTPSGTIGLLSSLVSLGALGGALVAPRLATTRPVVLILAVNAAMIAVLAVVVVLPRASLVVASLVVLSACGPLLSVLLTARVYAVVPDELMGRVQSAVFFAGSALYPFGSVAVGALLVYGIAWAYGLVLVCLLLCLALSLQRAVRTEVGHLAVPAEPPSPAAPAQAPAINPATGADQQSPAGPSGRSTVGAR